MAESPHPSDQHRYQVRFDWGVEGLRRLAQSDIVVLVDVLGAPAEGMDAAAASLAGEPLAVAAAETGATVLLGDLRTASAAARAVLDAQRVRSARTSVAVIAVGGSDAGGLRFTVEDLLGAGAVIAALSDLGIDHTSPEAAAACEAFRGLRGAVRHLLTASGSGQELIERGHRDGVLAAADIDADDAAPVLRGGSLAEA